MNRHRLYLLARVLDKVPEERFEMKQWVSPIVDKGSSYVANAIPNLTEGNLKKRFKCGFAACACGWALTIPSFRRDGYTLDKFRLSPERTICDFFGVTQAQLVLLFGPRRRVTAKQVAADVRHFCKTGTTPEPVV